MSSAIDARASAMPRSLAYSSLSYLTLVVLILLARTLVPRGPDVDQVYSLPLPPNHDVVVIDPTSAPTPPPVAPVPPSTQPGDIVPVDQPLVDTSIPPSTSAVAPPPGAIAGTGSAKPGAPGPGTGPVASTDPPFGQYIFTETLPVLVHRVTPEYPSIAQSAGLSGEVELWLQVGVDGMVHRVRITRSSPMFDDAARDAATQWTFRPATTDGHPVAVWVEQVVKFTLRD